MPLTSNSNALRTISSGRTFLMKIVFPTFWIAVFGSASLTPFFVGRRGTDQSGLQSLEWTFLLAWFFGIAALYYLCIRLKRVRMDTEALYISNYRTEIRVPFCDISAVSEIRWLNPRLVTLKLCRDTEFGDQIVFTPKVRLWGLWSPHPIVAELRQAARDAGALIATSPDTPQAIPDARGVWKRRIKIGLGVVAAAVVFVSLLLTVVEGSLKSSEIYQMSVARAQAAKPVMDHIGYPLRQGFFVSGSLNESLGGAGNAALSIPVSGPKGSGRLYVEAKRIAGQWNFETFRLEVGQRSQFDLLAQ